MSAFEILSYLSIGALAGLLAGLFGVGGGAVIVPSLLLVFAHMQIGGDWAPHIAVACSLATIIGTAAVSTLAHQARRAVRWDLFAGLTPGILIGALLGSALVPLIPGLWLKRLFAVFLAFVGIRMILRRSRPLETRPLPSRIRLSGVGSGIGVLSALVGIGGGTLTVPFLNSRGVEMRQAVGTAAACGLPIAIAGTLGFMLAGWGRSGLPDLSVGLVYWPAVLIMLTGSMPTAPLGARLAHRLPIEALKGLFGALLISIALKLALG